MGKRTVANAGGCRAQWRAMRFDPCLVSSPPPQDELATFITRVNPGVQLTQAQMDTVLEEASALRV